MPVIHLHGDLRRFGGPFDLSVQSPAEAVRALCVQLKGFRRRLNDGSFHVVRRAGARARHVQAQALTMMLDETHELHIMPVTRGSKSGKSAILGIALMAASFAFAPAVVGAMGPTMGMGTEAFSIFGGSVSFGNIAGFGLTMVLGGISQLLAPSPKSSSLERPEERASFIFNGPVNSTEQGETIPLLFGRFFCSTRVISSGISTEQIDV